MKQKLLFPGILILYALLTTVSCQRNNSASSILLQAEQLMEARPDSALCLLEDSIQPATLSGKAHADWCLLITQARDKNWVKHTSDSLISIACHYYEKHADPERLMLTYYYMGRVTHDTGSALLAQDYYLKALEVGASSHNLLLKGFIYNQIGELYTYQRFYNQAIEYLRQAFNCYKQTDDISGMSFTMRDIGRVYHQLDSIDAALEAYQEALRYEHPNSRKSVLSELGTIYIKKKEYEQALSCLHESLLLSRNAQEAAPVCLTLGRAFREMGENDSARFYLYKCIDSKKIETQAGSYYHLYHLNRDEKNWPAYASMQRIYEELNDSMQHIKNTDQIRKANDLYHYQQAEHYKLKHLTSQRNAYRMTLITLLLLGGITALYIYFRKWRKQKESQLEQLAKQLHTNKSRITELETQLADSTNTQEKIDSLLEQIKKLETANEEILLTKKEQEKSLAGKFETSNIYGQLIAVIDGKDPWRLTDQRSLKKWVDKEYPFFIREVYRHCPFLKEDLKILAYLIRVGFDSKEIRQIYKVREQTVSGWKRELHKSLTGVADSAKGVDELIRSF